MTKNEETKLNNNDIKQLFEEWNNALKTGSAKKVSSLYQEDCILIPTISKQIRHCREEIENYFVHFLAKGPQGMIIESNIRHYGQLAINSGIYSFIFNDASVVQARFTFVYRWQGTRWLIVEHHSSQIPE